MRKYFYSPKLNHIIWFENTYPENFGFWRTISNPNKNSKSFLIQYKDIKDMKETKSYIEISKEQANEICKKWYLEIR